MSKEICLSENYKTVF